MKSIFTFILICFTLQIYAQQLAQQVAQKKQQLGHFSDKPSTHGMMLMGNEVIYALKGYLTITFQHSDLSKPYSWKQNSGLLQETRQPLEFKQHKLLYLEFDDLK